MSINEELERKFEELCETHFLFLERDFGFRPAEVKRDIRVTRLTCKNGTTGVQVIFERDGVLILLSRLSQGKIPSYPLNIGTFTRIRSHYLDTLLHVRSPEDFDRLRQFGYDVHQVIPFCARALSIHGGDVLVGDFSIFRTLDNLVRHRAKELKR